MNYALSLDGSLAFDRLPYNRNRRETLKRVYRVLLKFSEANEEASFSRIAAYLKLSRRTVDYCVKILKERRFIDVISRGWDRALMALIGKPRRLCNLYKCLLTSVRRLVQDHDITHALEDLGIRRRKRKYRKKEDYDCPFCGSVASFIVHPDSERGFCHQCGEKANAGRVLSLSGK